LDASVLRTGTSRRIAAVIAPAHSVPAPGVAQDAMRQRGVCIAAREPNTTPHDDGSRHSFSDARPCLHQTP
jgi:hypothetical protein